MNLRDETELFTHYYAHQAGSGDGIYRAQLYQKGYGVCFQRKKIYAYANLKQ